MRVPRDVWLDGILPFLSTGELAALFSTRLLPWSAVHHDMVFLNEMVNIIQRDYASLSFAHFLCPLHMDTALQVFARMHTRVVRDPHSVQLSFIEGHARILHAVQKKIFWQRLREEAARQHFWKRTAFMWTILQDMFHGRGWILDGC